MDRNTRAGPCLEAMFRYGERVGPNEEPRKLVCSSRIRLACYSYAISTSNLNSLLHTRRQSAKSSPRSGAFQVRIGHDSVLRNPCSEHLQSPDRSDSWETGNADKQSKAARRLSQ